MTPHPHVLTRSAADWLHIRRRLEDAWGAATSTAEREDIAKAIEHCDAQLLATGTEIGEAA